MEGNQYFTRNSYIDIDLTVVDRTGRTVYKDTVKDQRSETALFSANIDTLQKQVQDLLNATVDRMLDNPKLHSVLSKRTSRSGALSA